MFERPIYDYEEAKREADKMQELTGSEATKEEYSMAEQMIEEERTDEREHYSLEQLELEKDRVVVQKPTMDKHYMIGFNSEDPEKVRLFNRSAAEVTDPYRGFHQLGAHNKTGYMAWELWDLPKEVSPYDLVRQIEEKMREHYHQAKGV